MPSLITLLKRFAKFLRLLFLECQVLCKTVFWRICGGKQPEYHRVPIIINNFNRLDSLLKLIHSLEERGYGNIIILDNDSTYPPLLEYYRETPYEVIYLHRNVGFLALWKTDVYKRFRKQFYVYTDSDVVLDKQCPEDFMKVFLSVLKKHPGCMKVGFGIRIDDLPDCYKEKQSVIKWESQYWENKRRFPFQGPGRYYFCVISALLFGRFLSSSGFQNRFSLCYPASSLVSGYRPSYRRRAILCCSL